VKQELGIMEEKVQTFDRLAPSQWPTAGGKGGVLARLYQGGYPVPEGILLLPAAFAGDDPLPESWAAVQAHLNRMRQRAPEISFAIRSSALSEDSAQASFAGEFETVLDVRTDELVREAIRTVRRSRHHERVRAYSQAQNIDAAHDMAVIIQRLVPADISGVLFTADPVSGGYDAMTGNYVYGLGERLVSGEAEPYTFTLARPKGAYEGPPQMKRLARRLYRLAVRLEKELGGPQDIEWAVAGRKLYLLQSRPITTLQTYNPATGEQNDSLRGDFLWSNTNLCEAAPDVMTPAAWSLGRILHVYAATAVLPQGATVSGNICGRPYVNVSLALSIYRLLGMKPLEARRRLEELFGRLPDGLEPAAPRLFPLTELIRHVPANIKLEIAFRRCIKGMPEFIQEAAGDFRQLTARIRGTTDRAELASFWRDELYPYIFRACWMLRGSMKWFDEPAARLRHELIELVGPAGAHALLSGISSEEGFLDSLGPVVGVARVARGEMSRGTYLERYGHRGPHEWEVSHPQPAEDPEWLDRQLAEFRASPVDVEGLLKEQRGRYQAAWERFQQRYPKKAAKMERRIEKFAAGARLRETVRSEVTRVPGLARAFALQVGALTGLGEDVFFLTLNKMVALLQGDQRVVAAVPARKDSYARQCALPPYPSFIYGRFDPLAWAADPNRRSDFYDAHVPAPAPAPDSDTLKGFPGASGRVEGRVRLLRSIDDSHELEAGEILVAATTNVGWTPLFPRAAAIVTDIGAPLSHAAIVARELGIPAVVGCGDATMRLRTGDRVLVDGTQGVVHLLPPA
jgi:phosphohistidine swiveling domain-containing protein